MYLLPTVLAGFAATYFYVPDFLDIPLGMLTFRAIGAQMIFFGSVFIALVGLAKSVEKDPIWPWNRRFRLMVSRFRGLF